MRILFMGTPEIAATCLAGLLEANLNVVGVVSQPDKPRGRGFALSPTPVKVLALSHHIPVYQPEKLRGGEFEETLKEIAPDLIVVVAYGKILPPYILNAPKYGCINVHVSLLPKWRGAAPMQRAVMAGDKETGVTIMYMDEGMDTGDIICTERFPIGDTDTFETVHDRSAEAGARLLPQVIATIADGTVTRTPQDHSLATYAPKIEKEECEINFALPASVLDPHLRGLTPVPLPYTYLPSGKMCKVISAHPVKGSGVAGTVLSLDETGEGGITVACGEGALCITRVRPEGKGTMSAADFIRGRHLRVGERLGR